MYWNILLSFQQWDKTSFPTLYYTCFLCGTQDSTYPLLLVYTSVQNFNLNHLFICVCWVLALNKVDENNSLASFQVTSTFWVANDQCFSKIQGSVLKLICEQTMERCRWKIASWKLVWFACEQIKVSHFSFVFKVWGNFASVSKRVPVQSLLHGNWFYSVVNWPKCACE